MGLLKEHRRFYPNHSVAGQLLGTVSIDGEGQSGIERAFNEELRPKAQRTSVLRDAKGKRLMTDTGLELDSFRGNDVHLTLDAQMQQLAETVLAQTVQGIERSLLGLAMDPKTGQILVLANAPTFNPNTPGTSRKYSRNLALSAAFEPGSTMKTITFATALEAGVVRPEESIDCESDEIQIGAPHHSGQSQIQLVDRTRGLQAFQQHWNPQNCFGFGGTTVREKLDELKIGQAFGAGARGRRKGSIAPERSMGANAPFDRFRLGMASW